MTDMERAREYFKKDLFATELMGITISTVDEGYARCEMELKPIHRNAEGDVMGGALFTLADFTFAVAANLNQPLTVSLSCQISFLSAARGEKLVAEARRVRQGDRTCYYSVEVMDATGAIAAVVGVSGYIKRP